MVANIFNFITYFFSNVLGLLDKYDFLSQSQNLMAAQEHLRTKSTLSAEQYLVFIVFAGIVLLFLLVVIIAYFKERKKQRY